MTDFVKKCDRCLIKKRDKMTRCIRFFIAKCHYFITNCDSYYKTQQLYYKKRQLLQNAMFVTNSIGTICDSTDLNWLLIDEEKVVFTIVKLVSNRLDRSNMSEYFQHFQQKSGSLEEGNKIPNKQNAGRHLFNVACIIQNEAKNSLFDKILAKILSCS